MTIFIKILSGHYVLHSSYVRIFLNILSVKVFNAAWFSQFPSLNFEAVSLALRDHLIQKYSLPKSRVNLASLDQPVQISNEQRSTWRNEIRTLLSIPLTANVCCYNGSAKAWQCPDRVLQFFEQQYKNNPDNYLMILSTDDDYFIHYVSSNYPNLKNILIKKVAHTAIYSYLAACDEGIIFREPHIVNWTARPTKVLEYQAVGLKITHNNTIGMLTQSLK